MIAPGTVGVVATNGFAAGCIRLGTRCHYNHVVIADGNGGCYEAQPGGVEHTEVCGYSQIVWLTRQPLSDAQRLSITAWLQAEHGVPYNWPAIAVFALRTLDPWLPHKTLDGWADRRRNQICSELAVNAQRYAELDPFPGRAAATVSPADWLNLALAQEWTQ
jgi:hypothetical protein